MPTVRSFLAIPLILLMMAPSSAFADQRHVVDPSQLAAAVDQHVAKQDADRAAIHEALARPEVRDVATSMGLDLARATAAVDSLSGADLSRAADAARQVNERFVGGATTIVITTTTIIIVLLIVILIIVAVD